MIEGTPLIDPSLAQNSNKLLKGYSINLLDNLGNLVKSIEYEKDEYYRVKTELFESPQKVFKKMKKVSDQSN